MDPLDLAWAGGLFEGEGCFTVQNQRGKCYPVASVSSTDRSTLDRFVRAVGLGKVYGPYRQGGKGTKPVYLWQLHNSKVGNLLHLLDPWLSERRRTRARDVLYSAQ